jgi:prepilin peptidase CpaA
VINVSPMVLELIYGKSPSGIFSSMTVVLIVILCLAALSDLMLRVIPNWLIFIGLMIGLVMSASSAGFLGLGIMAVGISSGFLLFLPIYIVGLLGAGDVKLVALVGGFLGLHQLLIASLLIFLAGGVISLITLQRNSGSAHPVQVPYAAAIATGVLLHLVIFT